MTRDEQSGIINSERGNYHKQDRAAFPQPRRNIIRAPAYQTYCNTRPLVVAHNGNTKMYDVHVHSCVFRTTLKEMVEQNILELEEYVIKLHQIFTS